jgi:hypothetical protein
MTEDKDAIHKRAGIGHRIGYGKHPALLVIDMQLGFTAPEKSPMAGNLDGQIKPARVCGAHEPHTDCFHGGCLRSENS